MGIQINGNTNNINAGIGSLSIEDIHELDLTGIATASNFKTGSSNLHSTGLTVGNALVHSTGVNVGTGATVHSPATNVLTLGTNSNERLRIYSDGDAKFSSKLGVGVEPVETFDVRTSGSSIALIGSTNASGAYLKLDGDSNGDGSGNDYARLVHDTDGRLNIDNLKSADIVFRNTSSATERLRITSTGEIKQYGFTGSSDTAADDLVLGNTTDGVNRGMTIWSHSSQNGSLVFADNDSNFRGAVQYIHNGDILRFLTAGSERVRITSSGNIGAGTNNPDGFYTHAKNLVIGSGSSGEGITIFSGSSDSGFIGFNDTVSNGMQGFIQYNHNGDYMAFGPNGTEKLRIDSSGRVLIGTTDPGGGNADDLTVSSSGTTGITIRSTDSSHCSLFFSDATSGAAQYAGAIEFHHSDNTLNLNIGNTNRLRMTSAGRFGFNRPAPQYAIHLSPADGQSRIDLHMTNSTTGHNNNDGVQFGYQNSAGAYIWNFENTPIYFGTSNTERLNIDSSGRVTKPYTPAFLAYHYGYDVNYGPNATLPYPFTSYNTGNHYNTSNSTFTAPVAGRYLFSANANGNYTSSYGGIPRAYWKINGSNVGNNIHLRGSDASHDGLEQRSQTVIFNLAANDTVKIVVGQNQWDLFGANSFTGYLIG